MESRAAKALPERRHQQQDLSRFLEAQREVYDVALRELQQGKKRTHWMWFIFPQLRGLGRSDTALHYGIADLTEAQDYLSHPILGARLIRSTDAALRSQATSASALFGYPDDLKFISCMTLFSNTIEAPEIFHRALEHFNGGQPDNATLAILRNA